MCISLVNDDPFTTKYVSDQYKTQEMFNIAADDHPDALEFVPDHYMTQEMCDKAVDDYYIN